MRKFTSLMRLMTVITLSLIMVVGYAQRVKPTGNIAPKQMEKNSGVKIDKYQSSQNAMDELKKLNSQEPAIAGQTAQMTNKSALPVSVSGSVKFNSQPEPTETVLWSQMDDPNTGAAYNSQDFEAAYDIYDNRMSDDFTVTGGPWTIGVVSTVGVYYNGAGPAVGFNIEFFADAAGMPGASLGYYFAAPYSVAGDVYSATLSPSLVLPNGTYWVSIQARMDFGAGGQFGIAPALAPQVLTVGKWINPLDGFGTGATTWTPMTTVWPAIEGPNWCFQLETPLTCPQPTALFTSNITPTSAKANWTAGGSETSWKIEYGPAGFTPGTGTLVTVGTPFYTMPGLSLGYYSWYVRAVCGVGDESSNSGPVNFTTYPPPANDECGSVTPVTLVSGVPVTFTGNNNGATVSCPSGPFGPYGEVWEAFTITGPSTVTLDYCGSGGGTPWGDLWLNLMTSCPCGGITPGATYEATTCGDGNYTLTWTNLAAGTYWYPVMLDQAFNSVGAYTIHVVATTFVGPANDNCASAIPIGEVTDLPFSTVGASFDGAGGCMTSPNIWYDYTATASGNLTVDLCGSSYDTYLGIYDGLTCVGTLLGCNDDACGLQSSITINGITAGQQFKIEVGGFGGGTGAGDLSVSVAGPCVVTCPGGSIQENEADIADEGADVTNGGCNSIPNVFTPIAIGDTYCGKINTYLVGGNQNRDTDWYLLDLSASTFFWDLTWTATAEFDLLVFIIDAATGDCSDYVILAQGGPVGPCTTAIASVTGVAPGVYYVWVGPSVFTGFPSATGPHDYVATLTGVSHLAPTAIINPASFTQYLGPGGSTTDNLSIGNIAGGLPLDYTATVQNYADATYNAYPANANYNTGTCDDLGSFTQTSVMNGYGYETGFGKFNLSGIPAGATILSVTFNGYLSANSWPYWAITSLPYDPLVTSAATINSHIIANYSSGYSLNYESGTLANGWLSRSLGGTAVADLQAALAQGWFSIGITDFDFSTAYYVTFDGWAEANKPYLTVEYTLTPLWLTLNGAQSTSGTVVGGATDNISVGFNAASLAVGTYTADISIVTNEPGAKATHLVPVTLYVGYAVSGYVYYGVTGATKPMQTNTTVTLTPGPTVPTGAGGTYLIRPVANGSYKLFGATTKAWGGLQAFDATLVARYLGSIVTFTNLQKRAADVNLSNTITAFDGTLIKRRLGSIATPQWTAPAYVFDGPFPSTPVLDGMPITVAGANVTQELRTLCSGDLNSSFTPPAE